MTTILRDYGHTGPELGLELLTGDAAVIATVRDYGHTGPELGLELLTAEMPP